MQIDVSRHRLRKAHIVRIHISNVLSEENREALTHEDAHDARGLYAVGKERRRPPHVVLLVVEQRCPAPKRQHT